MSKIYVDEIAGIASADTVAIPGHVIQVVNNTMLGRTQITSTSFNNTHLTDTITPTSASSKILVLIQTAFSTEGSGRSMNWTLYRDSTNLGGSTEGFGQGYNPNDLLRASLNISYLDSPNTTSAVTYTLYGRSSTGATVEIPPGLNMQQQIVLMEIAG